jgi:hypothetical protein
MLSITLQQIMSITLQRIMSITVMRLTRVMRLTVYRIPRGFGHVDLKLLVTLDVLESHQMQITSFFENSSFRDLCCASNSSKGIVQNIF